MELINCFEIRTAPIMNAATEKDLEKVLSPNKTFWIEDIRKLCQSEMPDPEGEFSLALPGGFTYNPDKTITWSKNTPYICDVFSDIKKTIDELIPLPEFGVMAPLFCYRKMLQGWGEDFVFFDGEALTMKEFLLHVSGPHMSGKKYYVGSIFECVF